MFLRDRERAFVPANAGLAHQRERHLVHQIARREDGCEAAELVGGADGIEGFDGVEHRRNQRGRDFRGRLGGAREQALQFEIGPAGDLADRVPLANELPKEQQALDVRGAVLAAAPGMFGLDGVVAAFPGAQSVEAQAGNFRDSSNRIEAVHSYRSIGEAGGVCQSFVMDKY